MFLLFVYVLSRTFIYIQCISWIFKTIWYCSATQKPHTYTGVVYGIRDHLHQWITNFLCYRNISVVVESHWRSKYVLGLVYSMLSVSLDFAFPSGFSNVYLLGINEWVLYPSENFFSYIMARTSIILAKRWWCPFFPSPTRTLNFLFIVLAHWNNSLPVDMSSHLDTLSWFRVKRTNSDLQNMELKIECMTRTPIKTGGEIRCSGRVGSSCSTSGTRRVNLVTNPVISHE